MGWTFKIRAILVWQAVCFFDKVNTMPNCLPIPLFLLVRRSFYFTLACCSFFSFFVCFRRHCHCPIYVPCARWARPRQAINIHYKTKAQKGNTNSNECHIKHTLAMHTQCEKWVFAGPYKIVPNMLVSYLKLKPLVYFIKHFLCIAFFSRSLSLSRYFLSIHIHILYIRMFFFWKIAQIQMRYVVWILNDNNIKYKPPPAQQTETQNRLDSWAIKILYRIQSEYDTRWIDIEWTVQSTQKG